MSSCIPVVTFHHMKVEGWSSFQWHNIHTKFCENQSIDSEVKTEKHRLHSNLITFFLKKGKYTENRMYNL